MKTIPVNKLTNEQLDYFCAKAQGWEIRNKMFFGVSPPHNNRTWFNGKEFVGHHISYYSPTSDTQAGKAQCWDLIVKFEVVINSYGIMPDDHYKRIWCATSHNKAGCFELEGDTLGEAITRAVVASVFGESVEVEDDNRSD